MKFPSSSEYRSFAARALACILVVAAPLLAGAQATVNVKPSAIPGTPAAPTAPAGKAKASEPSKSAGPVVIVDPAAPATATDKVRSLAEGFARASVLLAANDTVTLSVAPGTYRERIAATLPKAASRLIFKPASGAGEVVLTDGVQAGSDWRRKETDIYSCDLPADQAPDVAVFEGKFMLKPKALAREDEKHYFNYFTQQGRLYFKLHAGIKIDKFAYALVKKDPAAEPLLAISGPGSFEAERLVVRQSAAPFAARFDGLSRLALRDTRFEWNASRPVHLSRIGEATWHGCIVQSNREGGLLAEDVARFSLAKCTSWFNGWLDKEGTFENQLPADTFVRVGELKARGCRITDQHSNGWTLEDCTATLDSCLVAANRARGLVAKGGFITLSETQVAANSYCGLLLDGARSRIEDCVFYDNARFTTPRNPVPCQIVVAKAPPASNPPAPAHRWRGNIMEGTTEAGYILSAPEAAGFENRRNMYFIDSGRFALVGTSDLDLAGWQAASGTDKVAIFADPVMEDPANYKFDPDEESPWFDDKRWPKAK